MIRLAHPWLLLLLPFAAAFLYYLWAGRGLNRASLRFPSLRYLGLESLGEETPRRVQFILRAIVLALLVLAAVRPQFGQSYEEYSTEGVDIMLALDISQSMLAEDFEPQNRVEAAKAVMKEFVQERPADRIGLVAFARFGLLRCPLSLDHNALLDLIDQTHVGLIDDGTAIGLGIATATARLSESKGESRILILLTDGANNSGNIDPPTAARIAAAMGIKIYTVGAARAGMTRIPIQDPMFGKRYVNVQGNQLDEKALREIADITGGLYFHAEDLEGLRQIYKRIDELEKTEYEVTEFSQYNETGPWFLWFAFLVFVTERVLMQTRLRTLP
ncbi:MAG: VWA domain-containing protein [Candidatus Omnitrophica bacterium]|nr:VWA domain-containing protein [Candidatus Omnitrophota bacterium]